MPWSTTQTTTINSHTIAWGVLGTHGPPLVLLHGTPFSSQVWAHLAPLFARTRTVYFHDLLGYGESSRPAEADVSLGAQNGIFATLVRDVWRLERPDVIAHDFGGATALRAHLLDGLDYNSLTLIDPVATRPWGSELVQHIRRNVDSFAGMPAFMHEAIVMAYLKGAVSRTKGDEQVLERYLKLWTGEGRQASFYQQIAQMDERYTDDIQDKYGEMRCPVQILWGEEDEWIPIERGRELNGLINGSFFVPVPGSGHLMQEDKPEVVAFYALAFLQEKGLKV